MKRFGLVGVAHACSERDLLAKVQIDLSIACVSDCGVAQYPVGKHELKRRRLREQISKIGAIALIEVKRAGNQVDEPVAERGVEFDFLTELFVLPVVEDDERAARVAAKRRVPPRDN